MVKRHAHDDEGAVMVEFAFVLPVLVTLLIGIIEFGQAYNIKHALQAGAREGARAAALGEDAGDVTATAENAAAPHSVTVDLDADCPPDGDGDARVTVSKVFEFGIPFVDLGDVTLTATGVMRCGV
jgi:Flp pilus assembly protein TadG